MPSSKQSALVLVVDDVAETLSFLNDSLEESGFDVLVAQTGQKALEICQKTFPEIILLDAVMPGMDGFEVCRQLKANLDTRHIPVIFMTGLTESEHVVAGFDAGGVDYVTKPLRVAEIVARINAHVRNSRRMSQTQGAFDAFGQAALAVLPATDRVVWQTPLAKELLGRYFDLTEDAGSVPAITAWVTTLAERTRKAVQPLVVERAFGKLIFTPADIGSDEQWLFLLREESEGAQVEALKLLFNLTQREAEVLHWIILGKTDKTIAQIFGSSPRTVNKHVEHILVKLGVETRTAAAGVAVKRLGSRRSPSGGD